MSHLETFKPCISGVALSFRQLYEIWQTYRLPNQREEEFIDELWLEWGEL